MSLGDYAGRRALFSPDALAIVDTASEPHRRFTYAEMNERANRLARWLRDVAGVGKGDRVGMLALDGVAFLDAFFACAKLGAIFSPFNRRLHNRELADLCALTTPKVLLFSSLFKATIESLAAQQPMALLHLDGDAVLNSLPYEATLASMPAQIVAASVEEDDIVCFIFTGGTTGLPKAAQISHKMIGWNTLNTLINDLHHGDITVNVFPMFHTGGLLVYTLPLYIMGGTIVLTQKFDPAQVLTLLQQYQATVFVGVPTMYQLLMAAPNWPEADLSNLRFCTSGGAPLPLPLIKQFRVEKGVPFKQGFGMSEFGPGIFALASEDTERKAGSIGRPNFFVQARIVDDANQPVPPDTIGELVLKGPSRASGYFQREETGVDDEGWFHTGDLARADAEDYFFIVDRKKDMFISGGENIYPSEIEQALYEHPAVGQCAVIGVPDATWGEVGRAYVVLKPDQTVEAQTLIDHLTGQLARYKVPRTLVFVEALPISGAGKILKRELRDSYLKENQT